MSPERRKHRRMQVMLAVDIVSEAKRELARAVEISAGGLRIEVPPSFSHEERITVQRGELSIPGRVVWRRGRMLGVEFDEVIDEHAFLRFRNLRHKCPACDRTI